jgi:transcriptional regulator with XRE-family HTH domain
MVKKKAGNRDPIMPKLLSLYKKSGKTLDEVGLAMGYESHIARQSVYQFLHATNDPRLSMLRKFAQALGVSIKDLVGDD